MPADQRGADGSTPGELRQGGEGEPAGQSQDDRSGTGHRRQHGRDASSAAAVATAEVEQQAPPAAPASSQPEQKHEIVQPSLAELKAVKEQIRNDHPSWYPEYRDTLGHQFNEQLVPQLFELSATELGLPASTHPDRVRREIRALAFARSYLMAQAGNVEGLKAISPDLLYFWDLWRRPHKFHYAEGRIMLAGRRITTTGAGRGESGRHNFRGCRGRRASDQRAGSGPAWCVAGQYGRALAL
jgi:hypothetical protein